MAKGWAPYPTFVPGPPPPSTPETVQISNQLPLQNDRTETPILSRLYTDSLQSPSIHSVSSADSCDVSGRPKVEPPVIQIDDDDDPIAEAMAAVGLDPGLIDEIKEPAIATSTAYADYHSQSHIDVTSPNVSVASATSSDRLSPGPTNDKCLICNSFQGVPEEITDIEQHAKHMRQHFRNLIAGNEQPNPNLTAWLKCYAPLSLERNIFCRLCQTACRLLIEHANKHGMEDIDFCFPRWTKEQLIRLGFMKLHVQFSEHGSSFQSRNLAYQQTTARNVSSTVFVQETGQSFNLPKSDFDLLDNLENFIGENDDDHTSTPSPGRLVIDMPDENYSPALVIEEIVDEDSCGVYKTVDSVDSSFHVDTDNLDGVYKTVDSVDSSLIIDNGYSYSVDNNFDTVDSSFHVYIEN